MIATDELIDLVTRLGVIEPETLWPYLAARGGATGLGHDASSVVEDLIKTGYLTEYQGQQLLLANADGLVLGKYHLLLPLGQGSNPVYLAERRPGRQYVALKILTDASQADAPEVQRFRLEVEALARLDHPSIVSIKDSGQVGTRMFLAMEYIDGESLADLVARDGMQSPSMASRFIYDALDAVGHIHDHEMLHRNLRPEHLLLDPDLKIHIISLGMAHHAEIKSKAKEKAPRLEPQTPTGDLAYFAPEVILPPHKADARSDVYSLGAILYLLLTGKPVFNEQALSRLASGIAVQPQSPLQIRAGLPRQLAALVEKMINPDPAQRFATTDDAAAALKVWAKEVTAPTSEILKKTPPVPGAEIMAEPPPAIPQPTKRDLAEEPSFEEPTTVGQEEANAPAWLVIVVMCGLIATVVAAFWFMLPK
jgi:serine/threonine protein kinase